MAAIGTTPAPGGNAPATPTDFVGLAELRARAARPGESGRTDGTVTREAARQFEALFVQMMLKSMRDAGDVFGDGSDTTYRDMFDQQVALEMTKGKGLGIADMLTHQLGQADQDAAAAIRQPGARDYVAARQAAIPSLPTVRPGIAAPDAVQLAQSASMPAFEVASTDAGPPWRDWRPATPEEFIRDVWPHAERAANELGVDPRAIVAQAALETGWGRKVARDGSGVSGNNLFNIKADAGWDGQRVSVRTLEYEDGLPKQTVAAFRAYPDIGTAFADYVRFLKTNPRYAEALKNGAEAGRFADSLQSAGYATDPDYADKLRSIAASPRLNDVVGRLKNLVRLPNM